MRERPWGRYRRRLLGIGMGGAFVAASACTLIAGIDEGVLVNAGPGDGGKPVIDGGKGADGGKGSDGGKPDATTGDAGGGDSGTDAKKKGDGGADTAVPPKDFVCTVVNGSKVTVDDLSRADAGATTFDQALYITPNGGENGFGVITGLPSGPDDQFVAYTVNQGNVSSTVYSASLVDVVTAAPTGGNVPSVISILTSANSATTGMSTLTLFTGTKPGSLVAGSPFASLTTASYQGGKAAPVRLDGGAGIAYATITQANTGSPFALAFGLAGGTNGPDDVYEADASFGFTNNAAFLASAGSLYGLLNQIQPASGTLVADSIVSAPDSLTGGGIVGTLGQPPNAGALVAARASATTPNEVTIFGGTVVSGGDLAICAATVPPSMIRDLTLCGPGFSLSASQSMTSLSFGGAGNSGWNLTTDDLAVVGPNGPGTMLNLVWIAPDARIVALDQGFVSTGSVQRTAIQFDEFVGENTATNFDIAWIERDAAPDGGTLPDKLIAAVVNCE